MAKVYILAMCIIYYSGEIPARSSKMSKTEIQGYYKKDGTFVSGYFREGKPDLLPPDKFMADYYPQKEEQ
ncbi:MAG: hypothetical protein WC455_25170 [Dehalococcoidia bacterium]|jgi:hypothetical protein